MNRSILHIPEALLKLLLLCCVSTWYYISSLLLGFSFLLPSGSPISMPTDFFFKYPGLRRADYKKLSKLSLTIFQSKLYRDSSFQFEFPLPEDQSLRSDLLFSVSVVFLPFMVSLVKGMIPYFISSPLILLDVVLSLWITVESLFFQCSGHFQC